MKTKTSKIITLDDEVKSGLDKVKEIISGTKLGKAQSNSKSYDKLMASRGLQPSQELDEKITVGQNTYQVVLDALSKGTRNTSQQIEYLSIYEQALSVFREASLSLRKEMDVLTLDQILASQERSIDDIAQKRKTNVTEAKDNAQEESENMKRTISDAIFLSNRYALYFAGQVGLGLLKSKETSTKKLMSFGTNFDNSRDRDALLLNLNNVVAKDMSDLYKDILKDGKEVTDESFKFLLENIFTTWSTQFNWSTFKDIADNRGVEDLTMKYGQFSVANGKFSQKHSSVIVDERFMNVRKKDLIGNKEFVDLAWSNLVRLSAYDAEKKNNPHDPASVIFVYGQPGCGKTYSAHGIIKSFSELCMEKGVPLWAFTHSMTDFASEYQNKTANELANIASKIREFPGPVIMYVADADTLFSASRKKDATAEQQNTLSVYFKMFDGSLVPKNGKFLAIMDANYIDQIDDATKSRLFDDIYEMKRFESAKDFADMARLSLEKRSDKLSLDAKDWQEIGEYILATPLSNREIDHVLKKTRRGFAVPESMVGASYEDHVKLRAQQLAGMTKDGIISTFNSYISTRSDMEEKSRIAKIEDSTAKFLDYLDIAKNETINSQDSK